MIVGINEAIIVSGGYKNMNEHLDLAKTNLDNANELRDISKNPVVNYVFGTLKIIPGIKEGLDSILENYQKSKREELCKIIFEDGLITLEDVKDISFLMEFGRTLEIVDRLAVNEKVKYIAKLFRKSFELGAFKENISEYEEYLKRLENISIRELNLLNLLYECENDKFIKDKKSSSKKEEVWKKFKNQAEEKFGINQNMIVPMISSLTMTGFCIESNIMFPDEKAENPYYITDYFRRFLELIS